MMRALDRGRMRAFFRRCLRHAGACIVIVACGSGEPTNGGSSNTGNNLVFMRAAGTRVQFAAGASLYAWCGPWETGVVPTQSVHVWYGGPASSNPYWYLRAVVADVVPGQPLGFPNSFTWDAPTGADLFLADPPTNELSTQTGQSSGSLTFEVLTCASGGQVRFTVNAVIGSEFGNGPSATVSGTFQRTVGQPPSWAAP